MVEGSRCFASGELPGAAAAGPAGSTGVVKHDKARYFFVVVPALLVIIFVKEGCLLLFLLLPRYFKGLLFQDLPRLFNIFQNLSKSFFSRRKVTFSFCFFQDLPRFAFFKMFQNFPKSSRIFRKVASPKISWEFSTFLLPRFPKASFRSFPDFPEVFWDSPGVFHWLSNTPYTGNRWGGQVWFPVWFTQLLHLHVFLVRLVDIGYIRFCG